MHAHMHAHTHTHTQHTHTYTHTHTHTCLLRDYCKCTYIDIIAGGYVEFLVHLTIDLRCSSTMQMKSIIFDQPVIVNVERSKKKKPLFKNKTKMATQKERERERFLHSIVFVYQEISLRYIPI